MVKFRKHITCLESYSREWLPENLKETIEYLQSILESIPEDMRDQATIEFESEYDTCSISAIIEGVRDETEPERIEREKRYARAEEAIQAIRQKQERQLYEELKRKYEWND